MPKPSPPAGLPGSASTSPAAARRVLPRWTSRLRRLRRLRPAAPPVAVEDSAEFAAVFGADAPLAWDAAARRAGVRPTWPGGAGFFRNGGRRCWVVRVAGPATAQRDRFELPGRAAIGRRAGASAQRRRGRSCGELGRRPQRHHGASRSGARPTSTNSHWRSVVVRRHAAGRHAQRRRPASGFTFAAQDTTLYATVGQVTVTPSQIRVDEFLWVWPVAAGAPEKLRSRSPTSARDEGATGRGRRRGRDVPPDGAHPASRSIPPLDPTPRARSAPCARGAKTETTDPRRLHDRGRA